MNEMNPAEKFNFLRKTYPVFTYDSYSILIENNGIRIKFSFNISDKYFFHPEIFIPQNNFIQAANLSEEKLQNIAFHIGMIEMLSYWKAACSPQITIHQHCMNNDQVKWWKKLYYHGLGEFFYLNDIQASEADFVEMKFTSDHYLSKQKYFVDDSIIIPVGGGKDSVVTLELLGSQPGDHLAFILNPRGASIQTAVAAGYQKDKIFEIHRSIDPELLKLNDLGFLNGHTPFSALLAFDCILAAMLTGKKNIALSNESSANESTVNNTKINHQYSKSFEFERDFRDYVKNYISEDFNYFSFLRPVSELQIAKFFSRYPDYFHEFKSCNAGSKTDIWCGSCPKCLFVFIILSPFIPEERLVEIFGKNLFDDESLLFYFNQLCGIEDVKPFECVGTIDEVCLALCMTIDQYSTEELPALLLYFKTTQSFKKYSALNKSEFLNNFNKQHFLRPQFEQILKSALND